MPMSTADAPPLDALARRRRDNPWLRRTLVFIACVLLADSLLGDRGLVRMIRADREYRRAQNALTTLRNENAGLREQIRRLSTDPRTLEDIARQELGLVRPGEVLFIIRDVR